MTAAPSLPLLSPPRARLLIVEDEFIIASECEWILSAAGFQVLGIAADEDEALSLAEQTRPELVLMDIRLARGGDGIEAAKLIKSQCGISSLFVSAHADPETKSRGSAAEPVGWLVKPYTGTLLLQAVDEALAHLGASSDKT